MKIRHKITCTIFSCGLFGHSQEQHEMGDSDGVGFFQEKSAGKKLIRLFVPNFLGLYTKLLPET